jgi:hypothetical protein
MVCATPPNSSASGGTAPPGPVSGRHREQDTTPGGSKSSPSKNRAICSGVRRVMDGVPTAFQCRTASSMASPEIALVEWLMAKKMPGASAFQAADDAVGLLGVGDVVQDAALSGVGHHPLSGQLGGDFPPLGL